MPRYRPAHAAPRRAQPVRPRPNPDAGLDNGWPDHGKRDNGRRDNGRRDNGRRDGTDGARGADRLEGGDRLEGVDRLEGGGGFDDGGFDDGGFDDGGFDDGGFDDGGFDDGGLDDARPVEFVPAPAPPAGARVRPVRGHYGAAGGRDLRRRRLIGRALALVVLAGLGVSVGGVIRARQHEAANGAGTGTESDPAVTTPATVVSGGPPGAVSEISARVEAENARPGSAGWKLTNVAANHEIEGYADHTSITAGQPVTLFVSTTAPDFHVEVYRMGYYQGLGARLVVTSQDTPGFRQAAPHLTPVINMVEASWIPSLVLATDSWPEGDYLLKLVASTGKQRYVPLTVRNDTSTAAFVVINAVTTWQAYNQWGGYDLYQGATAVDYGHRSRMVSFDRPYALGDGRRRLPRPRVPAGVAG